MPELYPDVVTEATNLTGDVSFLQNNNVTDWYTTGDVTSNTALEATMDDPADPLAGTQTVTFYIRRSNDQANPPSATFSVVDSGTATTTQLGNAVTLNSLTGETHTRTFETADVSSGANVGFRIDGAASGGMPATRETVEMGYITWDAQVESATAALAVETRAASGVDTSNATLNGELTTLDVHESADVWFDYRPVGAADWTATTRQTLTAPGTFNAAITVTEGTEYEFRAQAESADASQTSTGGALTVWSHKTVGGTVEDAGGTAVEAAAVYVVDFAAAERLAETTTAADGTWSVTVPGYRIVHAAVDHADGATDLHALSYPYVE